MQRLLVVCGVVAALVGLGFVFPQIATLRDSGTLAAWQVVLLGLGVALAVAGVIACGKAAISLFLGKAASGGR